MKEYKWLLLLVPFLGLMLSLDEQEERKNTIGKRVSDFVFGIYHGYWIYLLIINPLWTYYHN